MQTNESNSQASRAESSEPSPLEPLCWWESRRIAWNFLVLVTALAGHSFSTTITRTPPLNQLFGFGLVANYLYTFCYIPELFFRIVCRSRRWLPRVRWTIFLLGCGIGVFLAIRAVNDLMNCYPAEQR